MPARCRESKREMRAPDAVLSLLNPMLYLENPWLPTDNQPTMWDSQEHLATVLSCCGPLPSSRLFAFPLPACAVRAAFRTPAGQGRGEADTEPRGKAGASCLGQGAAMAQVTGKFAKAPRGRRATTQQASLWPDSASVSKADYPLPSASLDLEGLQ